MTTAISANDPSGARWGSSIQTSLLQRLRGAQSRFSYAMRSSLPAVSATSPISPRRDVSSKLRHADVFYYLKEARLEAKYRGLHMILLWSLRELNCDCLSYLAFLFSVSIRSLAAGPDEAGFWPVISWPSATV